MFIHTLMQIFVCFGRKFNLIVLTQTLCLQKSWNILNVEFWVLFLFLLTHLPFPALPLLPSFCNVSFKNISSFTASSIQHHNPPPPPVSTRPQNSASNLSRPVLLSPVLPLECGNWTSPKQLSSFNRIKVALCWCLPPPPQTLQRSNLKQQHLQDQYQ